MGGPTLAVYLPQLLTEVDSAFIHDWLAQHTVDLSNFGGAWEFYLLNEHPCSASLAIVPFGAEAGHAGTATDIYLDEQEISEYERLLGYRPLTTIQLDNYCNSDKVGHRGLAGIAALLARKYGGYIDLGPAFRNHGAVCLDDIQQGTCITEMSGHYTSYLVDAEFMEAWMQHPHFYLVK